MRSSRSARRGAPSTCALVGFGGFRGRRARRAIEAYDRAAKPRARSHGRAQRARCAGTSTPRSAKCCSEQAKASKGLNSPASRRGAAMLRHSSAAVFSDAAGTLKAKTRKCWARMETLFSLGTLKQPRQARPHKTVDPSVISLGRHLSSAMRAVERREASLQNATTKNPPHSTIPPFRGLHCSYRVLQGILRHK